MADHPETRYATTADGDHVAYQVIGDGPIDVLYVMGWVQVAPQSAYMQAIAPVLEAKKDLMTDFWMGWVKPTPTRQKVTALANDMQQSLEGLHSWIEAIHTCPKPVIAAVEGAAAGAGFSLALACDFLVAADNAIFVMAYSTVGLSPDGGATFGLGRALPRSLA
jgi:hypothetical protein